MNPAFLLALSCKANTVPIFLMRKLRLREACNLPKITLPGARIQAQPCLTFPQLSGASWPGQQPGTRCVTYLRPGKEPLPLSEVPHRWVVAWSRLPGLVWGQGPTVSSPPGTQPEWVALICFRVLSPVPSEALGKPLPLPGS